MAVRRINSWYWIDFRVEGIRYRKRSPENSKAGAQAFESVLRQRLARGECVDGKKRRHSQSFSEFSKFWFDTYVKSNNKPTEQRTKEWILRCHLVPFFGSLELPKITTIHVERFKALKQNEGQQAKSINNHLAVLSRCLTCAEEWGELEAVPKMKRLRVEPRTIEFLSERECRRLLSYREESVLHSMIAAARYTGMRNAELRALRWSDVDFDRQQISVRHAFSLNELTSPKNNRVRHIPMAGGLCRVLASRRKQDGFVFCDRDGSPIPYDTTLSALRRVCRKTGVRRIGWHVIRHTFASHLVTRGVPIRAVQQLLGHASIVMTERYAHLAPSTLHRAVSVLEQNETEDGQRKGSAMLV